MEKPGKTWKRLTVPRKIGIFPKNLENAWKSTDMKPGKSENGEFKLAYFMLFTSFLEI